jgi:hypothetical protein
MAHAKSVWVTTHVNNGREPTMNTYSSLRVAGMGMVLPKFGWENVVSQSMGWESYWERSGVM